MGSISSSSQVRPFHKKVFARLSNVKHNVEQHHVVQKIYSSTRGNSLHAEVPYGQHSREQD